MSKIKGIATLIEELVNLPIAQAAMRMTLKEWDTLISRARNLGAAPADIKKLEKIQKRKQRPALGKDTPKGTDKITKLTRIPFGHGEFSYRGKTGSAAITAFRKNPMSRDKFLDQIREQAIEKLDALENLSHAARESGIEQIEGLADKYWKNLHKAANPSTVPSKAFKQKSKSNKPYRDHLGRPVETKAEMYKFDEPSNLPHLSVTSLINKAPVDITKMKSVDEYVKNILNFADDQHKKAGEELIPVVVRDLSRWAKKDWKKHTKNIDPNKPKKPTMQKGGSYKGKKHNYSAGGKVNELKNFKKRKV